MHVSSVILLITSPFVKSEVFKYSAVSNAPTRLPKLSTSAIASATVTYLPDATPDKSPILPSTVSAIVLASSAVDLTPAIALATVASPSVTNSDNSPILPSTPAIASVNSFFVAYVLLKTSATLLRVMNSCSSSDVLIPSIFSLSLPSKT